MARKLPVLERALDVPSLAAVAYGEIACSLYFALGVVALHALGLTPWVLLVVGLLFLVVAASYAEGTAAIPETGGAAMFVRRAFNDQAGFLTGWVLFLDYLIVIALAALFAPHYLGHAVGWQGVTHEPWDVVAGVGVILGVAAVRLVRRPGLYGLAVVIAGVAFAVHLGLIVLGGIFLLSREGLGAGVSLGEAPSWHSIAFALPLAMLAYTGLETVANLAAETRAPGRTLPRSLFFGIGAAVAVSVAVGAIGVSAFPAHPESGGPGGWASDLGVDWLEAPLVGITVALGSSSPLPGGLVDVLRVVVGVSGTFVLIAAVTTSISGAGRLAYSLGKHDMLPHAFARLNRRTLMAPAAIVSTALIACGLLVVAVVAGREVRFLASLFSFGVLLAFTAAQVAVIRLRFTEPDLERPFRAPFELSWRGTRVPLLALVGVPLTFAVWIVALVTHPAPRIVGPLWLLAGIAIFVLVRRSQGEPVLGRVTLSAGDLDPAEEGAYTRILVPLKLGPIGDEVLATAIRLAEERNSAVRVLHGISVPLSLPLEAQLPDLDERAWASLGEARELAAEHGVEIETETVRTRALGEAIVEQAYEWDADLILMGSHPRWRRQARFFSPTVDYVLRKAPCEVMVIAYPQGVLEEEEAQASATLAT
ncbi:MAG: amino acid permease [Gaiellaceae bacterium]